MPDQETIAKIEEAKQLCDTMAASAKARWPGSRDPEKYQLEILMYNANESSTRLGLLLGVLKSQKQ